ncbi:MAG: hypothetical protein RBG13Loki_0199 [Promethearchaeota archaeon CR_4]|nr:MAG: hypothetical protein RBG13Loki_0199 [Candidatus Lokiarchaeota archaeon CR_4]
MTIPAPSSADELIYSQRLLLGQIKRSHRLFVIRFWVVLITSILAFGLIALLFYLEDESSIPTFFMLEALPIIILIRSFKENWVFLKWSGPYLRDIEESGKTSTFLTGLTAYINRLYQAAFLDSSIGRKKPNFTPGQFLEEISKRYKLKLILIGVLSMLVLCGAFFFFKYSDSIDIDRIFMLGSPLLMIVAVAVVMVIFQAIWMRSLKQWARIFQDLDEWGKELERGFLKSQIEEKRGG